MKIKDFKCIMLAAILDVFDRVSRKLLPRESLPNTSVFLSLKHAILIFYRHLRPSMMQQLLRRLVFDVPMLSEYCKVPLQVRNGLITSNQTHVPMCPYHLLCVHHPDIICFLPQTFLHHLVILGIKYFTCCTYNTL